MDNVGQMYIYKLNSCIKMKFIPNQKDLRIYGLTIFIKLGILSGKTYIRGLLFLIPVIVVFKSYLNFSTFDILTTSNIE